MIKAKVFPDRSRRRLVETAPTIVAKALLRYCQMSVMDGALHEFETQPRPNASSSVCSTL